MVAKRWRKLRVATRAETETSVQRIRKVWPELYYEVKKVKWSCYRPGVAQRVGRGIDLLYHDRGTRRGWVVSSTLWPHFTPGKTRYPFYRRLGGHQGRFGHAENLVPTWIRSRTVQPVVSRYTDWATGPITYISAQLYIQVTLWQHVSTVNDHFQANRERF